MCFVLYAGTINAIPRRPREKDAPGVSVESLTDRDAAMRPHFSNPEIQYIGSTSGCGCAFPHVTLSEGEWPFFEDPRAVDAERDASDRRNREALVSLLRATDEETVELYGVWDGDFMEAPKAREVVLVERLLDSDFRFKEQGFYGVTVKSTS
jgi:hypothetical protein